MVEGFRVMVGGTIQAALRRIRRQTSALSAFRVAVHIGGGLHHAFPNHGEGFCPLNDVAVAVRVLQQRGIERAAIVDLDVHHGNGTAFIFESDPRVFTFSMHQQHNYPMWKPRGSLDIGLPDGVHDMTYLEELEKALPTVMASRPQCVFYLAGADPYKDDQLGGLRLTREGLRQRDRMVIEASRASVPLVIVLAGGYARNVDDTVAIPRRDHRRSTEATDARRRGETRCANEAGVHCALDAQRQSDAFSFAPSLLRASVSPYAVFKSTISPRAAIAFASWIVNTRTLMFSSSSGL